MVVGSSVVNDRRERSINQSVPLVHGCMDSLNRLQTKVAKDKKSINVSTVNAVVNLLYAVYDSEYSVV